MVILFCIAAVISTAQTITTVAGGLGDGLPAVTHGRLLHPHYVAVDQAGNIYITDNNNSRVRKVNAATGIMTTIAGTGGAYYSNWALPGHAAYTRIQNPEGIVADSIGNVYVSYEGSLVGKIDTSGTLSIIAGTGSAGYNLSLIHI